MSFLQDYMFFTKNHEAPQCYQLWSGISALSSLVSRRVHFSMGHFSWSPALYVILVGDPGIRKSTAMNVAKRIVQSVPEINFSGDATTAEKIKQEMFQDCKRTFLAPDGTAITYSHMSCFVGEFADFLGSSDEAMVKFLTAIWGEDRHIYKTKTKGSDFIELPFLNILGCATPSWINSGIKSNVIGVGLTRRIIWVYASENRQKNALPRADAAELAAWERMCEFATSIQSVCGEMTMTDEAREYYVSWYNALEMPTEQYMQSWINSKHEMAFKVAMLMSLSEGRSMKITRDHFIAAVVALDEVELSLHHVLGSIGRNELKAVAAQFLLMLDHSGGKMTIMEAKKRMFAHAQAVEIDQVFAHLKESQLIFDGNIPLPGGGKEPIFLSARQHAGVMKKREDLAAQKAQLPEI